MTGAAGAAGAAAGSLATIRCFVYGVCSLAPFAHYTAPKLHTVDERAYRNENQELGNQGAHHHISFTCDIKSSPSLPAVHAIEATLPISGVVSN